MASPAQIAANRANAQKSTGPRAVEGKSASRFNALKHGIDAASIVIPGEDPADYDALVAHYLHEYCPQSASESFHVDTMIRADWQKRRLETVEADLFRTIMTESSDNSLAAVLLAESPAAKLLLRIQRQIAAFERTWYRANTEFRRARTEAEAAPEGSLDSYLDFLTARPAPGELASLRQSANIRLSEPPAAPTSTPNWPPIDEKTGRPASFVG
jgi:hypothetical protein